MQYTDRIKKKGGGLDNNLTILSKLHASSIPNHNLPKFTLHFPIRIIVVRKKITKNKQILGILSGSFYFVCMQLQILTPNTGKMFYKMRKKN